MSSTSLGPLSPYASISLVDFEFQSLDGNRPIPVCMVVKDQRSGEVRRYWRDELLKLREAPFPVGSNDLFVAFYASGEFGCMLELGWPLPLNVLDLYAEHRVETNGLKLPGGNSLIGALAWRKLTRIEAAVKDAMRDLILTRTFWSQSERAQILDYCASDVESLDALLGAMLPTIDLPRALLRGRYTKAVAHMERNGVPIDADARKALLTSWSDTRVELIKFIDKDFGFYRGTTFKAGLFSSWLRKNNIPWPRSENGRLLLDDETFKEQVGVWPILEPVRELRQALGKMYLPDLQVGRDGRSRSLLSPFSAVTGRNQPPSKKFAFGPPRWQRGVIRPPEGWGLGYIDFASQEIGIAAGLSGDERLIDAYVGGDPYLAFAKQAGLAPPDATKRSHPVVRDQCKCVVLGLNYGLGVPRLAYQAGISEALASELVYRHRQTYRRYWQWNDDVVDSAFQSNQMSSVFGWHRKINGTDRRTSLMNFPMQANGAEVMRLAAIAATEAGIEVCAPVHDAFLIAAPLERLDEDVAHIRELMGQAGEAVTGGIRIRTDAKTIRFPDRYMDEGGAEMWNLVVSLSGIPEAQVSLPSN